MAAAASYFPSLYPVGKQASDAFPKLGSSNLELFVQRSAFDFFCCATLGASRNLLVENGALQADLDFAENAAKTMKLFGPLIRSPTGKKQYIYSDHLYFVVVADDFVVII